MVFLLFLLCVWAVVRLFLQHKTWHLRPFSPAGSAKTAELPRLLMFLFWLYISTIDVNIYRLFTGSRYDTWRTIMRLSLYYLSLHITHPAQERLATLSGSTSPTLLEQWFGFFYVPQEPNKWECCEMWPTVSVLNPNRLQMSLQRKHFLLSYFETLSVRPAGVPTRDLPLSRLALSQLSWPGDCQLHWYTAISREVVGKSVHATIPKGNMGYDQ